MPTLFNNIIITQQKHKENRIMLNSSQSSASTKDCLQNQFPLQQQNVLQNPSLQFIIYNSQQNKMILNEMEAELTLISLKDCVFPKITVEIKEKQKFQQCVSYVQKRILQLANYLKNTDEYYKVIMFKKLHKVLYSLKKLEPGNIKQQDINSINQKFRIIQDIFQKKQKDFIVKIPVQNFSGKSLQEFMSQPDFESDQYDEICLMQWCAQVHKQKHQNYKKKINQSILEEAKEQQKPETNRKNQQEDKEEYEKDQTNRHQEVKEEKEQKKEMNRESKEESFQNNSKQIKKKLSQITKTQGYLSRIHTKYHPNKLE